MPDEVRIAVTGIGPVTPIGVGADPFWDALRNGRSGIGPLTLFDASAFPSRIAGQITDFDVEAYIEPRRARRMDRYAQFAYAAAKLALADAGLEPSDLNPSRVGIVVGSGIGGLGTWEQEHKVLLERGPRRVSPSLIAMMMPNSAAGQLGIELGFNGPNECTVTACAASGHALARSIDYLRTRRADVVLAGGAEAVITPLGVAGFCSARALSTRNDEPERASRPFDAERDGFVVAEGATVLVLERMDLAEQRGARILAEVLGYGLSSDAYHLVAPEPDGAGATAAMTGALADAGVDPSQVGYINAHGTSTELGDASEAKAIRKVFGDDPPPTSSTKSMTGHMLGAAGTTEAAATVLALANQVLPPTINYENPDPACDLDVVPNEAREAPIDTAISNSFGFGGHNVSIAFGRVG
ncbi:MAG: beta-ketoacyl-ACP synthase II [Actinomycetota bacterium]